MHYWMALNAAAYAPSIHALGILFYVPSLFLVTYFVPLVHDIQNGLCQELLANIYM